MIRKYMFGGLTLVLIVVLVFLIIRGRKMETQKSGQTKEIVQVEIPTPTRALAPRDIKIEQDKMTLAGQSAQHELFIRNLGPTAFSGMQLRLEYFNARGKTIATKTSFVQKNLPPGGALHLSEIKIDNLPVSISTSRATIISADLADSTANLKE